MGFPRIPWSVGPRAAASRSLPEENVRGEVAANHPGHSQRYGIAYADEAARKLEPADSESRRAAVLHHSLRGHFQLDLILNRMPFAVTS